MIANHHDATLLDKDDFLEALFDGSTEPRHELSREADELFVAAVTYEPRAVAVSVPATTGAVGDVRYSDRLVADRSTSGRSVVRLPH